MANRHEQEQRGRVRVTDQDSCAIAMSMVVEIMVEGSPREINAQD